MAKDSVEVEIKIPVTKSVFRKVRSRIKRMAKFVGLTHDVDKYFNAPHRDFLAKSLPEEFLRIRSSNKNSYFTYKHGYWDENGGHTHSDEYETKVDDHGELEKILKVLNFENILVIDKVREIYRVKKDFEVCFDKVKNLGYFIEIEALKDFGGKEKAMGALYDFARKLGLDPTKRNSRGYVTSMLDKKGFWSK